MKTKQKRKNFKLINELYAYALFVRCGGTVEEAEAWFRKKFEVDPSLVIVESKISRARTFYLTNEPSHLIWFEQLRPSAGLVAHEALHSTCHIMRVIGFGNLTCEVEEAFTYLLQWTVKAIGRRVW